ncbi:unnamed protein product [Caenorhabditis auriculariae]|uniref:Centrosomal protein CEP104 N-terminal domain-containing protein n=1 Tax=Caenorhabditis auriculariae TaxID=2777116 RepID=A0A8S1H561_9PELO|nr:unnamed protein product [Caenorhabditis auriculariae]
MTEEKRKGVALRELYWKTLVLGSHYPEEFTGGRFKSVPTDKFPIDIVIGLEQLSNVYKVVIEPDDDLIPSKVSVRIGQGDVNLETDYKNARLAKYRKPVQMEFHQRGRSMSRLETKKAFTDAVGQYVWITVHKPLESNLNPHKLVAIKKLTILGYPFSKEDILKMMKFEEPEEEKDFKRPISSSSAVSNKPRTPDVKPKVHVERYSYEGDGMKTNSNSPLGDDPLSSLRTIRRVLIDKMNRSTEEGRSIEATVCLRATQRIDEYEARIEDLAIRRSNALTLGDSQLAERHRLAMIDCRDTVLRAVHIDLLLDRDELRAIGVQSQWTEE